MQHLLDGPIISAAIVLPGIMVELLRPGAGWLQETLLWAPIAAAASGRSAEDARDERVA